MDRRSDAALKANLLPTPKPEAIIHNQHLLMEVLLEIRADVSLGLARIEGFKALVRVRDEKEKKDEPKVDPLPF